MILLTGATGTIGSELARILSSKKIKFRAYVRNTKKAADLHLPVMEVVKGDMEDTAALKKAMKGITRVFLLSSADPRQADLQKNVIAAAKGSGVELIVKQSAFGTSHDSPVGLARWHYEIEEELKGSGIPYCILRPMMFFQNLLMSAGEVRDYGTIHAPMGDAKASFIDARDIAKCAASILTGNGYQGRIFDLTGPEAIGYDRIAEALAHVLGHPVVYDPATDEETKAGMAKAGVPDWLTDDLLKLYEIFRTGRASIVTTSVRDITGEKARSIDTFCNDYAQMFAGEQELVHN